MKYCPQCHKQYTEQWITFCHDDGTILIDTGYTPSAQPTPSGGQRPYAPPYAPEQDWRSPDPNAPGSWVPPQQQPPMVHKPWAPPLPPNRQQPSQGLAIASMVVGVVGLVLGTFCLGPIPGIAALVLGLVALNQIKKSPDKHGGKPLAIIGVVLGSLSLLVTLGWIILFIIGSLAGN